MVIFRISRVILVPLRSEQKKRNLANNYWFGPIGVLTQEPWEQTLLNLWNNNPAIDHVVFVNKLIILLIMCRHENGIIKKHKVK